MAKPDGSGASIRAWAPAAATGSNPVTTSRSRRSAPGPDGLSDAPRGVQFADDDRSRTGADFDVAERDDARMLGQPPLQLALQDRGGDRDRRIEELDGDHRPLVEVVGAEDGPELAAAQMAADAVTPATDRDDPVRRCTHDHGELGADQCPGSVASQEQKVPRFNLTLSLTYLGACAKLVSCSPSSLRPQSKNSQSYTSCWEALAWPKCSIGVLSRCPD